MTVWVDSGPLGCRLFTADRAAQVQEAGEVPEGTNCIKIGLLNNMSDSALEQTERQILKLLHAASNDFAIRLTLYALPAVPRQEWGLKHLRRMHYGNAVDLWNEKLDGLIITGAEPRTPNLIEEVYWQELGQAFDWADRNTISTITSCLAVHAAAQYFDGIERCSLDEKSFGVFDFEKVSSHFLLTGVSRRLRVPHSRWNEIKESALLAGGYDILTSSPKHGVDIFSKLRRSLFVFFQGHPEYEPWTLLGEFRRDVTRFLGGGRKSYPPIPQYYFDDESALLLSDFRARANIDPRSSMMVEFPIDRLSGKLADEWRISAVQIYSNWLKWIRERKNEATRPVSNSYIFATSSVGRAALGPKTKGRA